MGMRASADVVYGVDLGDPYHGDSYVEHPDEGVWEDGLSEALDEMIGQYQEEVLGQPSVNWSAPEPERSEQIAALHKWRSDFPQYAALGYDSYGYEYAGTAIISRAAAHVTYGATPFSVDFADTGHDELEGLLKWLEGKGLRFTDPEKRKPGWLLLASYG